jgi:UDP-glucose 4-epimerase
VRASSLRLTDVPRSPLRVLITGGAGFIGSHVTESLLAQGHEVTVLDDLSTGKTENLAQHERLEFIRGDITNPGPVLETVSGKDAVIHLAAVASVDASVADPMATHRVNLEGTIRLLQAAKGAHVPRFVYASSAAVYGDVSLLPINEEAAKNPLSPYAADKLAGEQYLAHFHRQKWIDGVALRFFNIFGPRQDPSSPYSGVINIFAKHAVNGSVVTVQGDGTQTRDFVFVEDVAEIVRASLDFERRSELPVFNVGRGQETSLLQLLGSIEEVVGKPVKRDHGPSRIGDVYRSCADIGRLRAMVPGLRFTTLSEALEVTLDWLKTGQV